MGIETGGDVDTNDANEIRYAIEPDLTPAEFIAVLVRSTLAPRRPIHAPEIIAGMLANADLIVTARAADGLLVGVARSITDFTYCTYLADLGVDAAYQGRGIGRALIARTHAAVPPTSSLILLAAPGARTYYPHIGMEAHPSCWILPRRLPPAPDA